MYHGSIPRSKYSGSQQSVDLHSTPGRAWRAWRYAVEREAAQRLRHIDKMIEEADMAALTQTIYNAEDAT